MTSLSSRGYTVLPEPQRVALEPADIEFDATWRLGVAGDPTADDDLCAVLDDYLGERHGVTLRGTPSTEQYVGPRVVLSLRPGRDAVTVVGATDQDLPSLTAQGYEIQIGPDGVHIGATARAGLFYGIATLVQLIRPGHGRLWLPQGRISDWPDVARRHLLWDDSEHLDRLETLKAAVRQAALFKVNGFVLKLNGHFVYASAPELAAPQALTPEEFQELTDYGLKYHIQVIPYVDSPGHVAWILKHPSFRVLREFPDCNYELCTTDPNSYRLLTGLFDDLLAANKGVEHFVLSTDEAYYVGLGRSRHRARELGSIGKLEAEFVTQAADYLHSRGRTVQIWGEYPIEREDIPSLPPHVINGVATGPKYDPVYAANGIRQFIYAATQAELPNFPDYFAADPADVPYPVEPTSAITTLYDDISRNSVRRQSNLAGVFIAAWADGGLHPETFWLGFVTGAAWAWHPCTPEPTEAVMRFGRLFYGNDVLDVYSIYELMSTQAQFYEYGWDLVDSTARSPLFGDSYEIHNSPRPAKDRSLSLPDLPRLAGDTLVQGKDTWSASGRHRAHLAGRLAAANDNLVELLHTNLRRARFNRHNLKVLSSIAALFAQNLNFLQDLNRADRELRRAELHASDRDPAGAIACLDLALDLMHAARRERNATFRGLLEVWSVSMHLKTPKANGRELLHVCDDVKDHLPDRTTDMSYLIHRQLLLPIDAWFDRLRELRNDYAVHHDLSRRHDALNWADYPATDVVE